ncbi:S1C family serine protease [Desulfovibrio cuneatus]|uniref:S1C family serine protease n=1 Tax=Desulfovibrio cuneatus TaxID=159728 RepID=UPI0006890608|nr:trypsin-like peptidase domain-containing protein [Desulfovibrio cuneatus]
MRKGICALWVAVLLVVLAGCAPKTAVEPAVKAAPTFAGKTTRTVSLGKITSNISEGTEVGTRKYGTPPILPAGEIIWEGGMSEGMYRALLKGLEAQGLKAVGNPDSLFGEDQGEAELYLGGIISHVSVDVYHDTFIKDLSKGQVNVDLTMDWQVYDALERRVVYKKSTQGVANIRFTNRQIDRGLYAASVNAMQKLLADPQVQSLLVEQDATSAGGQAGAPGTTAGNKAGAQLEGQTFTTAGAGDAVGMETARKSVVTVLVGLGHGSGFVVNKDGLVITNQHVVGSATKVMVLAHDGQKYPGTVLARNSKRDVAAVLVPGLPLAPLKIRTSPVAVGEDIYAIGSPKDIALAGTVTKGIVSGMREMRGVGWIQGDAAINPGNSGGPLLDGKGRVVGISTLARKESQGIYFYGPIGDVMSTLGIRGR